MPLLSLPPGNTKMVWIIMAPPHSSSTSGQLITGKYKMQPLPWLADLCCWGKGQHGDAALPDVVSFRSWTHTPSFSLSWPSSHPQKVPLSSCGCTVNKQFVQGSLETQRFSTLQCLAQSRVLYNSRRQNWENQPLTIKNTHIPPHDQARAHRFSDN